MTQDEPAWKAAALVRLANAKSKGHRRLGHRKSRGGCTTCKTRRLKCDEAFPECSRCIKSGRRCEGYTPSPTSSTGSSNTSVILSPPNQYSRLQDLDRRPFEYFLHVVAPVLGATFDRGFWSQTVLQVSHEEEYVKDSILAISILHENPQYTKSLRGKDRFFDPDRDSDATIDDERLLLPPFLTNKHSEALQFYNRAIKTFRRKLADGKASPVLALLSCLLFSCIDVLRDHIFGALQTVTQAAHIVRQHDLTKITRPDSMHIDAMRPIFHRMSNLAAVYGFTQPALLISSPVSKSDFTTITKARDVLFQIAADINFFIWRVSQRDPSYDFDPDIMPTSPKRQDSFNVPYFPKPAHASNNISHPSILSHQSTLHHRLRTWTTTFSSLPPHPSSPGLWLYYHTSFLLLSTHLSRTELAYDQYTPTFRSILHHARQYISSTNLRKATFTFEQGAIGPLSIVALKCRVPSLRRQALRLIDEAPRKEAMWGAAGVGQLCARVINVEEEGLGLGWVDYRARCEGTVDDRVMPSKEARARYVELLRNAEGEFEVRVTRHDGGVEVYAICD